MKHTHTALALFATLALGGTAFAECAQCAAGASAESTPVVTKVVNPSRLPLSFDREVVNVRFALDEQGQPQHVQVLSNTDRAVKQQVVEAFKQWRFEAPAAGTAIESKRFVMPIDIVPEV